ncbi:MAG TPA: immunoglobulin domain-containing protein [Verrucomicrobiae bacterium]
MAGRALPFGARSFRLRYVRQAGLRLFFLLAAATVCMAAQNPPPDPFAIADTPQSLAALAVQADGKILAAGVRFLARYGASGAKDTAFNPTVNNTVYCLALQPDGRILVGGEFTSLAGGSRNYLGRLNTNGTLDASFTPSLSGRAQCVVLQPDGKILVAGRRYVSPIGYTGYVLRLATNGVQDASFSLSGVVAGPVSSMALQEDGRVLLGGLFLTAGGQSRPHLARRNSNGSLDTAFNPRTDGIVTALAVQPDGSIIVGGSFNTVAGQPRTNLARLNPDGTLDGAFDPRVTAANSPTVYSLALQTDGKIALGGWFTAVGGQPRQNLARLLPDGALDTNFTAAANNFVYALGLQDDGRLLAAGDFGVLAGEPRTRIGRLLNAEPAAHSLTVDASTLTWLRDGSKPEVSRTTFEVSTNLAQWTLLGAGARVAGGWQLTGAPTPPESRVRARGYVAGGGFNASSWFVEAISGSCYFVSQPSGRTNNAGTIAVFSGLAQGTPPLTCQWLRNGVPLQNSDAVSGAQSSLLSLAGVFGSDQGDYSLVASNASGSITSSVAPLKVVDPVVTSVYYVSYANLGDNATISVNATGSPPLAFQWFKNGAPLAAATSSAFTLTNLQASDIGTYSVRVSNAFGVFTTIRMTLEVNLATPDTFAPAVAGSVYGLAERPDGGLVFSGLFSAVDGQPRPSLARTDGNGALEPPFDAQAGPNDVIYAAAAQPGGGYIVSGGFGLYDPATTNYNLARLTAGGALDDGFSPPPANSILAMAQQTNGLLVVGGWLPPYGFLARVDTNGSADLSFNPNPDSVVRAIAVQPDGKILVGGGFSTLGGLPRACLGRLNPDGTVDASFNPGANSYVNCLAVQADGKILVGGEFTTLAGQTRNYLGRLLPTGALDTAFNPGVSNYAAAAVYTLALQADGKIIVGGQFSYLAGAAHPNLGRLFADGASDPAFNPTPGRTNYITLVEAVGVMADGKTLVAGAFDFLRNEPRANIGRLEATDPPTQSLAYDGTDITWLRGGTSPEVWWTIFDYSTAPGVWINVGVGTRIAGGWRLANATVPQRASLRARGFTTGGNYNASSWWVESIMTANTPPLILANDPAFGIRSNAFHIPIRAIPGQTVVTESSPNLRDWTPVATNLVSSPAFEVSDPVTAPACFYRARVVPEPGAPGSYRRAGSAGNIEAR